MDPLRGEVVCLREFAPDDLAAIVEIVGDERVTDWLSFDRRSSEEAAAMLDGTLSRQGRGPRDEFYLAVTIPPSDVVIGFCRLGLAGVQAAKLGFAIHADSWGHGYATDAARTMIRCGFGTLGLRRISAAIGPTNDASLAIAKKLGMSYEGRLRDHVFTNGAWRDSLLFSILSTDWPAEGHSPSRGS